MSRRLLLIAALMTMAPAVAEAQIYAWHDSAGNLVLSDKPKDPSAKTYAVASAPRSASSVAFAGKADGYRVTKAAVTRATVYDDVIADHASKNSLNPNFVRAVIQAESGFNPRAVSPKGAMGLMQLMPQTAAEYGVLDAFNPMENIRAGVAYLKSLLMRYDQDESLALAAYNAGPGAVEKYGRSVPPYRETRNYVARIRAASSNGATRPSNRVFKTVQIVDGREVVRYTNKPAAGAEVVKGTDRQ